MKVFDSVLAPEVAQLFSEGGVGILRTDTLYGIVACAANEAAVARVYSLKGRDETKSPIVLISSIQQLYDELPEVYESVCAYGWPVKTSLIVPSSSAPGWIQRGNNSVAYRLPADEALQQLIQITGPLIAPSANPQGQSPAMSFDEARDYFGSQVDFYVDGGIVSDDEPSRILKINEHGQIERLR